MHMHNLSKEHTQNILQELNLYGVWVGRGMSTNSK